MQPIKIFNTLSGKKEDFHPLEPSHIKIYACGPTVYNLCTYWQCQNGCCI